MSSLVWVEIDSSAPDHNLLELKKNIGRDILCCAVVKSNAYGHGGAQIVNLLSSADWFSVNSIEEGLELREAGIQKPILVLGHVPLKNLEDVLRADLRLTVFNYESIKRLQSIALPQSPARVHLKIETGTGRQGILPEEIEGFVRAVQGSSGIVLEGLSTHFANIEDTLNHDYAERQLAVFNRAIEMVGEMGIKPPIIHTACTAAIILFPETHFTMVRPGIGIYGLWPSRETYLSTISGRCKVPELKPVLTWKTKIVQIKQLDEGSYVGYGCTYRTSRKTRLAVLPVGYADGYDRKLGNTAYVLLKGKRAPVVGRICMNMTMVDVTDIPDVGLEDEVVLLGSSGSESITAETMAGWAGTINYEIVCRISPLLERRIV
jgi:alanine racemase